MPRWVEQVCEPASLILAWQAPDAYGDRFRWAVGEVTKQGDDYELRYIRDPVEFALLNQGREYKRLKDCGFAEYPGFPWKQTMHRAGVREALVRRLPPRERADLPEYLARFRISPETSINNFTLLGYSEGKLPSDGFSFVDTLAQDCRYQFVTEVAGYRYYADALRHPLHEGDEVILAPEPENPFDPNAVQVLHRGEKLGHINRLQARAFLRWISEGLVAAQVDRINGSRHKPLALIFVEVGDRAKSVAA